MTKDFELKFCNASEFINLFEEYLLQTFFITTIVSLLHSNVSYAEMDKHRERDKIV